MEWQWTSLVDQKYKSVQSIDTSPIQMLEAQLECLSIIVSGCIENWDVGNY